MDPPFGNLMEFNLSNNNSFDVLLVRLKRSLRVSQATCRSVISESSLKIDSQQDIVMVYRAFPLPMDVSLGLFMTSLVPT